MRCSQLLEGDRQKKSLQEPMLLADAGKASHKVWRLSCGHLTEPKASSNEENISKA
jgi:hypothetical protein